MNYLTNIRRFLSGYDFFISYSRADSSEYASNLANLIIDKGYSCFIDQWGTDPDKNIPKELRKKIKHSSVLILLASECAGESKAIEQELDIFLSTGRTIIPINLGEVKKAIWYSKIIGIPISDEAENFKKNLVSESLVNRIINSLTYIKHSLRIRYSILIAVIVIIVMVATLGFTYSKTYLLQMEILKKEQTLKQKLIEIKEKDNTVLASEKELKSKTDSILRIDSLLSIVKRELNDKQWELLRKTSQIGVLNKQKEEFINRTLKSYEYPKFIDCNCIKEQPLVVFFDIDEIGLNSNTKAYLLKIIHCLRNSKFNFRLNGFDNELNPETLRPHSKPYAISISNRRAEVVRSFMIAKGIDPLRIKYSGYGRYDDGNKLLNLIDIARVEIKIDFP